MIWICIMVLFLGLLIGIWVGASIKDRRTVYGNFTIMPIDEENNPGEYMLNVHIPQGESLTEKNWIMLSKDDSRN